MAEKREKWLWTFLRGKKRAELDKLEHDLIVRPGEKREFAGDPAQAKFMRLKLKQKK